MIINLGAERIILTTPHQSIIIPFEQVEEHLTKQVIEYYQTHLPTRIYVVNGPGSFTNLRVGALVVNLLLEVTKGKIQVLTLGKMELYRYLYLQGFIPSYGYYYFGQRKNFWQIDWEQDSKHTISKNTISDTEDISSDAVYDWFVSEDFPWFTDEHQQLLLTYQDGRCVVSYRGKTLDCSDIFEPTIKIEPIYGTEPNIG